jgi:hypothetical protein
MNSDQNVSERFVDADEAAKFLAVTRRRMLDLVRTGQIPGYPLGEGRHHTWLFRLSEIAAAVNGMKSGTA